MINYTRENPPPPAICPKCGCKMIWDQCSVQHCMDVSNRWMRWWCGCGHTEPAPPRYFLTHEEFLQQEWNRLNNKD